MKYVLIQAVNQSKEFKKDDRIVVSVNDEAFLATVTGIKNGKILLEFDDGDSGKVSVGSKRILGRGIDRKVKRSFPISRAENYIKQSENVEGNESKIEEPTAVPVSNKWIKVTKEQQLKDLGILEIESNAQYWNLKRGHYTYILQYADGKIACIVHFENSQFAEINFIYYDKLTPMLLKQLNALNKKIKRKGFSIFTNKNNRLIIINGQFYDVLDLPDNLTVKHSLRLKNKELTELPKNLKIEGNFVYDLPKLEELPNDLEVSGFIKNLNENR